VVKRYPALPTRVIINPHSGRAARALPAVRAFAARHGARLALTTRPHHASDLAREALAEGCTRVIVAGGDGTMNEVASVLAGTSAVLGLIPCGSGDGLGRHLGIHGPLARVLRVLEEGVPRVIDSGLADGHPFFCVAGLGFEAELAARFNRSARRGLWNYLRLGARALAAWRPANYAVTDEIGRRREVRAFTVAVANAGQYGNGARIAPQARIDDGRLDLCAVPPLTPWNAAPLALRLFSGRLGGARQMTFVSGSRLIVECAAPGLLHTDGETHPAGPRVEFLVRPASLHVLCPS
jgi:diacylglycerol kinase (ATP)